MLAPVWLNTHNSSPHRSYISNVSKPGVLTLFPGEHAAPRKRNRYIVATVVLVICVIALAVGLGVGLSKKSDSSETGTAAPFGGRNGSSPSRCMPQTTAQPGVDWMTHKCIHTSRVESCSARSSWSTNPVLLVSLDGFRADYLLRNLTPVIQKLRTCGVHTPYMRAAYPTLTFPNHYTIVTGLYPESHGIVGNSMYDATLNTSFSIGSPASYDPRWWGGEPVWITAKKQHKRTASYFWVGSDVNISGILPDVVKRYDGSIKFSERVDTVLEWLTLPGDERPDLITLYFDQPDHAGHGGGPNSDEVNYALEMVDRTLGRLMDGLLKHNLQDCVNLIVVADHGMEETSCARQVALSKYMDVKDKLIFGGTTGYINQHYHKQKSRRSRSVITQTPNATSVDDMIRSLQCKNPHLDVFTRSTIPKRHHYSNNARIGDVILDVHARWLAYDKTRHYGCLKGNHGYDNIYKSMHALFLAHGPAFKQNFTAEPFENIELYNLMTELLGIEPAPNNGTKGSLHEMLTSPQEVNRTGRAPDMCHVTTKQSSYDVCDCGNETVMNVSGIIATTTDYTVFGVPRTTSPDGVCVLQHDVATLGYSATMGSPVWASVTVDHGDTNAKFNQTCVVADPQLAGSTLNCSTIDDDDISLYPLFLSGTVGRTDNVYMSSEVVPMHNGFKTGIWSFVWDLIGDYASQYGPLSVTTGPIYDNNHDGLWEGLTNTTKVTSDGRPIPSHVYAIIMGCQDWQETTDALPCVGKLRILSFIIPNVPDILNCLPKDRYLKDNVARIRDIELLTGLTFMTSLPHSAPLRTFLPENIWPTTLIKHWIDMPCPALESCSSKRNPVLLVSLDGFWADYLLRNLTPVIQKLRSCGVHTPYMRAAYPTLTFPNHYTIVTGLYPESHGIVGNNMYDATLNMSFSIASRSSHDPRWWGGEPLWITAKKQNKTTASYFWVGSDVNISGILPDIYERYNGSKTFRERVDTVIQWLTLPEDERPDLITLYFDQPDHAGHGGGPDSEEVSAALEEVDTSLGRLMDGLLKHNIQDCVNLIVVADHGMEATSCGRQVILNSYMTVNDKLIFGGTTGHINPHFHNFKVPKHHRVVTPTENATSVDDIIHSLQCKDPHLDVFTRSTIPKRHHYSNNARIGDVILDVRSRWLAYDKKRGHCLKGNHGYDNIYKSMHALFLAHGPAFKQNFTAEPFENIELYNLMTELLGIEPAPNNGTKGSLHEMLVSPQQVNRTGRAPDKCHVTLNSSQFNECDCESETTNAKFNQTCIVEDPQLADSALNCSTIDADGISLSPLFVSGTVGRTHDVYMSTEVVPMYNGFKTGIWSFVWDLIADYARQSGPLSVTTGPIYDYDYDGLWEGLTNNTKVTSDGTPIPSHVYVIIVGCQETTETLPCVGKLRILPFILPNVPDIPNCLPKDRYLKDNVARIRDIEHLTGLTFMTSLPHSVSQRTFLPENIWPTTLIKQWIYMPCPASDSCSSQRKPVLLVSLDGFREDYLLRNLTPVIQKLRTCGVHTPYMRAVYPTLTFPNHYTIVTGLYPESHGIVGNSMYDPVLNKSFSISGGAKNDRRWWGGEPIWMTAKNQGKRTASYFWVGSEISGMRPDVWKKYSSKDSFEERVDTVLKWLAQPKNETPEFITLYFNQPDHTAHGAGPDSEEVNQALRQVDAILGRLMEGLVKLNLHNCVNLIIIADHGMEPTSCKRQVDLDTYVTVDDKLIYGGTTGHINPHYHKKTPKSKVVMATTNATSVDDIICSLQCKDAHLDVFTRSTIPKRHHYSNNARIGDVVLDVDARWLVYATEQGRCLRGNHGYDNIYKSMHALFLAHGPAFKHNYTAEPFENIELYNMMAEIMGLKPVHNNGTTGSLNNMLQRPTTVPQTGYQAPQCDVPTHVVPTWTCNCPTQSDVDMTQLFDNNNNNNSNTVAVGEPHVVSNGSVCVLYQDGSTTGYNRGLRSPVWTSVTVSPQQQNAHILEKNPNGPCIVEDPRVVDTSNTDCSKNSNAGLSMSPLFRADFVGRTQNVYLSSEVVPMYDGFKDGIWSFVWALIADYARQYMYGPLSVTTGPIFDYDHDGLWEGLTNDTKLVPSGEPVPTHIYVIIARCMPGSGYPACDDKLDVLSFILPHLTAVPNCQTRHEYLHDNVARIRDIELLTDLIFMTSLNPSLAVRMRTFLAEHIWATTL